MGLLGNLCIIYHRLILEDFLKDVGIDAVRDGLQILKNRKILKHRRKLLRFFGGYITTLRSRIGDHFVFLIQPLHDFQGLIRLKFVFASGLRLKCRQVKELRRMRRRPFRLTRDNDSL